MLTDTQAEFLKRYVISKGPQIKADLEAMALDERKAEVATALAKILKGVEAWQAKAPGMKDKEPRDQLVNYGWMDRDATAFDAMHDKIGVFLDREEGPECQAAIARLKQMAETGRAIMRRGVDAQLQTALGTTWPAMEKQAQNTENSRKETLQIIEALDASIDDMAMSLRLAGADDSAVDPFRVKAAALRDGYDASVPTFDGKVTAVPRADDAEPPLTYSDSVCLKIYDMCGRNWFELKKRYKMADFPDKVAALLGKRPASGEEVMWELWAYRKKIVDNLINAATEKFDVPGKGTGWVAVGSTNLESDYDLSVMQHGPKFEDHHVVDWFNSEFKRTFGTQPGIMFDTNLYASAPAKARMSDDPKTESEIAMAAMARSGQDVGALMKQRRFMSWEEYESMMNSVLDEMEAAEVPQKVFDATRKQFEEADDRYQMSQVRMLDPCQKVLADMIATLSDQQKAAEVPERAERIKELSQVATQITAKRQQAEAASGLEGSKLILECVEMLEALEDVMLEVNNKIYVEAVKTSRAVEKEAADLAATIQTLTADIAELAEIAEKTPEQIEKAETLSKALNDAQIAFDGKAARSKDLFTDAVFFANEAYHADGPFKHVVEATQAVDGDVKRDFIAENSEAEWDALTKEAQDEKINTERAKRRGALTLHECLQSFNEQLGDFIKDLHHHANDKNEDLPGTGFFRASKYLDRLIDAVDLLDAKAIGGLGVPIPGNLTSLEDYRKALGEGLLALRKGKIKIEKDGATDAERQEQMEAYAIAQIKGLFGVSTLQALGKQFKTFGASVNAKLRAQVALEMEAIKSGAYFAA